MAEPDAVLAFPFALEGARGVAGDIYIAFLRALIGPMVGEREGSLNRHFLSA